MNRLQLPRKQIIEKKLLISLILFALLLICTGVFIVNGDGNRSSIFILLTFYLNIIICFVKLLQAVRKHSYSLDMMFWIFGLFFFGFAPLVRHQMQVYSWGLLPTIKEITRTNQYITLWYISYSLGIQIGSRIKIGFKKHQGQTDYRISSDAINILVVISVMITMYFVIRDGAKLIIRSESDGDDGLSKAMGLIIHQGFRNTILFTTVLCILQAKKKHKIGYRLVISSICLLVSCFPTGLSRYMLASFYGGILIICFAQHTKKRWISYAIIGGLVVLFPIMNIFRNMHTLMQANSLELVLDTVRETYLQGHYDAHQMFVSIRRWAELDGLAYGRQLLGAMLFFVPRSIWTNKPYGTGQTSFERTAQHTYTNVSAPLVAESWINFGIVGIVVFGLLLGYVVRRIDKKYWAQKNELSCIRVIYPFSMFMFFFLQRGDMMSAGSYTFAQIVVGVILYGLSVRKFRVK